MAQSAEQIVVTGGWPLNGTVRVPAAKNSVQPLLAAALLCQRPARLRGVPRLSDVECSLALLRGAGCTAQWQGSDVALSGSPVQSTLPGQTAAQMRASILFCAPLLARLGRAETVLPGGCRIGSRPIDLHLKGFRALGATVIEEDGMVKAYAEKLIGTSIYMDQVSVGATINVMLAATMAEGTTTIENAAKEPHVVDTANYLNMMGANIKGAGTDVIRIKGVPELKGAQYTIIPDQIEAGTYMIAAAITGGDVLVKNIIPKHMDSLTAKLEEMNVKVAEWEDSIRVMADEPLRAVNVKTMSYPGFPTDLQPQIATLLAVCNGTSVLTENVWENRYQYMGELRKLGADVEINGRVATIHGIKHFSGAEVSATDLRAGAAMILAALAAEGETIIDGVRYIDRGYEDVEEKFRAMGADIDRIPGEQ